MTTSSVAPTGEGPDLPASADVVVVGAGLAGMSTALRMAERGRQVLVLTPEPSPAAATTTSSHLAQGGLAAAVGPDDTPDLHAADTLAAGAGLTEPDAATRITAHGPAVVDRLLSLGAHMDRAPDGTLEVALEAAHSRHRVVHAHGDSSGAEFLRATLTAALAHPRIEVRPNIRVTRVLTRDARVTGVLVAGPDGAGGGRIDAPVVVLATGGIGGQYAHTTNPVTSWGSGLALGLRAGARVRDLEMTQFHPTALAVGDDPMPLVSEAVRGEGVALVLEDGTALPDPLAPRDVVARAVWGAMHRGHTVYLDVPASSVREEFADHFPTVTASCLAAGIDPRVDRVPVRPALHYHMGGLLVDDHGRTDVPGLLAVGEVSSTGLHGANRLASNSLLEAVACADDLAAGLDTHPHHIDPVPPRPLVRELSGDEAPTSTSAPGGDHRRRMEECAGMYRTAEGLTSAWEAFSPTAATDDAALVAALLARAAHRRTESRGAHQRLDHPGTLAGPSRHTLVDLDDLTTPLSDDERSAP